MADLDFALVCAVCGKSLKGSSLDGVCAYCGSAVGASVNREVVHPVRLTVFVDAPCVRCGYNLFTMPIGACCPECGERVALSLRPDDLRFADPQWLRRVHTGITALLWSMIAVPLVGISIAFLSMASIDVQMLVTTSGTLIILGFLLLGLVGVVNMCGRDKKLPVPRREHRAHVWARFLPIFGAGAFMIGVFGPALFASLVWIRVAFFICLILLSIGTFVSVVSVVICMRRIAERGRDEGLADACRSLAALVIMAGICWIAGMLLLPFLALPSTSAVGVLEVCMGVLIIAGLVGSMLNYALSLSVLVALKRLVKGVMEERGVAHADGGAIDQFEADGVGESDDLIDGRS